MAKKFLLALGVASLPCLAMAQMGQMPQMPPGFNLADMQKMMQQGQTGKISEADMKLSCEELEQQMGAYMQDVQPQAEGVGKAAKKADEYQRQVAAKHEATAKAESAAIMAAAAAGAGGAGGAGGAATAAYTNAKVAEAAARQPQTNAVQGDLLKKSANLATAQPVDRTARMMQLQRVHEEKRCPPPEFMDEDEE